MFGPHRTAAILATIASISHRAHAGKEVSSKIEDCVIDWANHDTVGKSSGEHWCTSQIQNDKFISGIKTWGGVNYDHLQPQITGMQVLYSNGDYTTIGKLEGKQNELLWDPGKTAVKSVEMCGDNLKSKKGLLMAIRVTLTDDRKLFSGCNVGHGLCEEKRFDWKKCGTAARGPIVGLEGMKGKAGVEQLTFHTLQSGVKESKITDVKYQPSLEELNSRKKNECVHTSPPPKREE
jgi:hypothetical protein